MPYHREVFALLMHNRRQSEMWVREGSLSMAALHEHKALALEELLRPYWGSNHFVEGSPQAVEEIRSNLDFAWKMMVARHRKKRKAAKK